MKCVVAGDCDEHIVGKNLLIEEGEEAVFTGFDGGDVARETDKLLPEFVSCFAVPPQPSKKPP